MKTTGVPDPSAFDEPVPQVEISLGADDRPRHRLLRPEQILGRRISSAADLAPLLERYRHGMITLFAQDPSHRRWHMERTRPALRWCCRRHGIPVPAWLEGNAGYDDLSTDAHEELFGSAPLHVRDFRSWREALASKPEIRGRENGSGVSDNRRSRS